MKNLDEKVNKLASRIQEAFCEWHIHHKTCPTMSNLSICALRLRSNGLCGNLKGWKEPGAIGCGGSSCKYVILTADDINLGKTMMTIGTLEDALPTGAQTELLFFEKNSLPQSRVSCAKDLLHVLPLTTPANGGVTRTGKNSRPIHRLVKHRPTVPTLLGKATGQKLGGSFPNLHSDTQPNSHVPSLKEFATRS